MTEHSPFRLDSELVLITGASSGIGRATAVLCSRLGARVILTGRSRSRLEQTAAAMSDPGSHQIEPFDLEDLDRIPEWARSVVARFGSPTALIHCAGTHEMIGFRRLSRAKIEPMLKTGFEAPVLLSRAMLSENQPRRARAVVFVSSVVAVVGSPGMSIYGACKAALVGLTKSLAVELARDRVRVNCVLPGLVRTEMFADITRALTPEQIAVIEAEHPLGFGLPEDVATAIAFLIAPASGWVTGSSLVVDGGYTAR